MFLFHDHSTLLEGPGVVGSSGPELYTPLTSSEPTPPSDISNASFQHKRPPVQDEAPAKAHKQALPSAMLGRTSKHPEPRPTETIRRVIVGRDPFDPNSASQLGPQEVARRNGSCTIWRGARRLGNASTDRLVVPEEQHIPAGGVTFNEGGCPTWWRGPSTLPHGSVPSAGGRCQALAVHLCRLRLRAGARVHEQRRIPKVVRPNCPYCPCTAFGAKQLGPLVHNCRTCHMLPTRSKRTPRKCLCVPSINIQPMRLWASCQNATPLPLAHTKASTPNCKVVANFASVAMLRTMDIGHSIKV